MSAESVVYVAPVVAGSTDELNRQEALPLFSTLPIRLSAAPTSELPEVDAKASSCALPAR